MIGLDNKLVQTAYLITATRNKYGDIEFGAQTELACLYRDISLLDINVVNREEVDVDGIFWFKADSGVEQGSVILFEGVYYRVERIVKARRRVADNSLQFIKCEVLRQRQVS